jgi:endonuclease I
MAAVAWAQGPYNSGDYYKNADGKKGAALKTALCGIIYNRTERSYDQLWTDFRKTDKRDDGKVWDMYSGISNYIFGTHQAGNYSGEGEENGGLYNREHSFPKSWFGASQTVILPMYTDLFHLYPTDGFVNGMRSNYPFGETKGESYKSANGFSKLGACTYPGYTGKVFEPNDIYKGDFARTYFYMVTCYEEKLPDWYANYSESKPTLDGSKYPGFQTWQLNMLMTWAANDQVSDKEYNRNIAVYDIQKNRNPFIDYQGLEQYIWGSMKDVEFSYDNYQVPENYTLYIPGDDPGPDPDDPPIIVPSDGEFVYQRVTKDTDLEEGAGYIIVCEEPSVAMADQNGSTYRNRVITAVALGAIDADADDAQLTAVVDIEVTQTAQNILTLVVPG